MQFNKIRPTETVLGAKQNIAFTAEHNINNMVLETGLRGCLRAPTSICNPHNAGIDFRRHNLTDFDV